MERLLVATDFSGDSLNALEHAILWANKLQCHLTLVHIIRPQKFDIPGFFSKVEKNFAEVEEMLDLIIKQHSGSYQVKGGVFDYQYSEGKIYQQIISYAQEINAKLIIIGTHGVSGFEEYLLGSNAFRVVSKSTVPVLTIRHGYPKVIPLKIVLPIDVTNQSRQKVPLIADLAQVFGSMVYIIGVRETDTPEVIFKVNQYVTQVEDYLKTRDIPCETSIVYGNNITQQTITFAKNVDADLIGIMTEQTERPENIWMGPYAQQMVNHSPIPVLSMEPLALFDPNRV